MKKIYIVSWYGLKSGGLERVMVYLNDILSKKNNVEIVDLNTLNYFKFYRLIKLLKMDQLVFIKALLISLYLYLNKDKSDIIITNNFQTPFVKADFLFAHGSMVGIKSNLKVNILSIYTLLEFIGVQNSKKIIAVSKQVKEEYIKYYKANSNKIRILNNCVDTHMFYPMEKKYNSDITILFCGRLEIAKGLECLIALARKIENMNNIKFIIASNDSSNVRLFKRFYKTTVLVDIKLNDMNKFYNSGDVFFFPSLYEGFEMVTLEALSCGIPVVGNNIGALSELARNNFMGTTILKTKNINNIIDILISEAHTFKNYELRRKLHEEVKKKFDINIYEQKINHMFNKYL